MRIIYMTIHIHPDHIFAGPSRTFAPLPYNDLTWLVERYELDADAFVLVDATASELPVELGDAAAVIIGGSAHSINEGQHWQRAAEVWIRQVIEQEVPVLGICGGHQLIAHAYGGCIEPHPKGKQVGIREIDLTDAGARDPLFASLPRTLEVMVSYGEYVAQAPTCAVSMASTSGIDGVPNEVLAYGPNTRTTQFHVDISAARMNLIVDTKRQHQHEQVVVSRVPRDDRDGPRVARRFFDNIVQPWCRKTGLYYRNPLSRGCGTREVRRP